MTSSNERNFRITVLLCGEFTGHRWIPLTKTSDAELWCFDLRLNKRLSKQSWGWWFETLWCSLWRHHNEWAVFRVCLQWKYSDIGRFCPALWGLELGSPIGGSESPTKAYNLPGTVFIICAYSAPHGPIRIQYYYKRWSFKRSYTLSIPYYNDVILSAMASQITSFSVVYSAVCSGVDQRKHRSSASLVSVRGIHRWPVNPPHKGPVTRKFFSFDDVIMMFVSVRLQ